MAMNFSRAERAQAPDLVGAATQQAAIDQQKENASEMRKQARRTGAASLGSGLVGSGALGSMSAGTGVLGSLGSGLTSAGIMAPAATAAAPAAAGAGAATTAAAPALMSNPWGWGVLGALALSSMI